MIVKLKDVAKLQGGYAFKSTDFVKGGIPIVRIGNIVENKIFIDDKITINDYEFKKVHPEFVINKGDILVAMSGATVGKIGVYELEEESLLNQRVGKFVTTDKVKGKYLYYILRSKLFNKYILENAFGCAQPNISGKQIEEFEFKLYEKEQQKQIIEILDRVQESIDIRKKQIESLDSLIKARFVELFGDCKNEVLIGDVISISRGASPRPISAFITDRDDGVNWIKIGDVSENSLYITKTEEKITPEGAKKSRMVHKGDFILSNSMSFGRPYILGINGCVHDGWLIMSDFKKTFNELYLYHAIRSDDVQYQFSGKVNGATVKNLNSDLVKNTYIKVPSMELQEQFAAFVEQTDKSKLELQKSLEEMQNLFDSLMAEYFG